MKTVEPFFKWKKLPCLVLLLCAFLTACSEENSNKNNVEANLITLKEGQSLSDVIVGSGTPAENKPDEQIILTDNPESSGQPLFRKPPDGEVVLSDFEFCCEEYNTYGVNGFEEISGDFKQLNGGWWAGDVTGLEGDRVFSSFGDGFDSEGEALGWIGFSAVGSMNSPSFEITERFINFLIGGGSNRVTEPNTTAVALVINGEIMLQASGDDTPMSLRWVSWDVADYTGMTAHLRIIDNHPNDNSDTSLPYLLLDEIRISEEAAAVPVKSSKLLDSGNISVEPESEGVYAFARVSDPSQNIAGFEFCCGQFNTYANHDFRATGDIANLDGGWWAADIINHQGERLFSSRGDSFTADGISLGSVGDEAVGTLSSPPFEITHKFINFLIGGGTNDFKSDNTTAAVLRVNGKVVRSAVGNGEASQVDWHTWDVSALQGRFAVFEIIDNHRAEDDGSLAFIMVDEVRLADYAATKPVKNDFVSIPASHSVSLPLVMADPNPFYRDGEFYLYYLIDTAFHDWYLTKTKDLQYGSFPERVLEATGDTNRQDQWTGSGSVIEDAEEQTHIFYTGHNADFSPVEAVMHAVATDNTLASFTKVPEDTFTGSNGYSDFDFRDPKVFKNEKSGNYWMLITTTYNDQAAIGLYTSDDLMTWIPQEPLFTLDKPLNLEVPDWLDFGSEQFILFSDQNDDQRDIKYLRQASTGWEFPNYASLDGKYYYAGRTASSEDTTLMFGWVPHKVPRTNFGKSTFGGDLAVHQLEVTSSGELAVQIPDLYKTGYATPYNADILSKEGAVSGESPISMMPSSGFTLDKLAEKNRLSITVKSETSDGRFGLYFPTKEEGKRLARLELDTNRNQASFFFGEAPLKGGSGTTSAPELEGVPLFTRTAEPEQNIAGFEFCCAQYNALSQHGFSHVTDDFLKLDGGWWGGEVFNNIGERLFSSFGDGFAEDGTALGRIGPEATGTAESTPFKITKPYINFLIGGGSNSFDSARATSVVLVIDGEVVRSQSGVDAKKNADDKFVLNWATWNVSEFVGATAVVRFIDQHPNDNSDTALPYLLADQFRAADLPAVYEGGQLASKRPDAQITVPMSLVDGVKLDVWLDPETGFGSAYINDFRALTFRLYDLKERPVGIYTQKSSLSIVNMQRFVKQ